MYKKIRKGLVWILSFVIVMTLLEPVAQGQYISADGTVSEKTIIKEGDYILFGHYQHKTADGYEQEATPISWQVAAKKNGYVRLVSEYVLDERTMDETRPNASYSWLNSPYETWLNTEFYNSAFSEMEKVAMIDYDELYYTLDQNGENYSGYYYRTGPGIKVGIIDYYIDGYFNYASRPLGLGNSQVSHKNMRATLKDGTLADYWTGTTSSTSFGHHIITATETDATLGTSNGDAVHGVRPMIKLQLNKFGVTGSGTKEDPYVVSETFDIPDPVVWMDSFPSATLSGKTLTVKFSSPVKWTGVGFGIANFSVKRSDNVPVSVVSANLTNGNLVLQLDKSAPEEVLVTLNYTKPKFGYIMKDEETSSQYVDSFGNLAVTTVVPEEDMQEVYNPAYSLSAPVDVMMGTDAELDPGVPAWGGHQNRIVRTQNGVYMLVMVDVRSGSTGDPSLHPNNVRKFQILKIDASETTVLAEHEIAGQATSLVADKMGNLYVVCHDKTDAAQAGYGRPTIYKLSVGSNTLKQYFYDVDEAYSDGATNYEAVSVDADGNILVLVPYVNHTYGESRFIWTKFDVTTNQWSVAQQIKLDRCFLYPYILPQANGTFNVVAEIGIPYSAIEVEAPDGYTFLVNEMRMWNIPAWNSSAGVTQNWTYNIPFTEEEGYSVVQNASMGDSYTDSMGYTHTIMCATRYLGMDTPPSAMVYCVFDQNNELISETTPFIGNFSCSFVEDSRGNLYLIKMESGSNRLELYAIDESHTKILTDIPLLSQKLYTENGTPLVQTYSGISIASPRGGSTIEDYVDIIIPAMPSESGQPTTWQYMRLSLGEE